MKKIGLICLCICLLLTTVCFVPVSAEESRNESITSGCRTLEASTPLLGTEQLFPNADSVIMYEVSSQTLMYAWNADAKQFPASLVKIMTALIAVEQGVLTDQVTVSAEALDSIPYNAMNVELQEGEVLSLEDLLYCMMVGSGNDAAAVIAEHISGSQEIFVKEMNRYAQELGCTGTNFTNAHGLHDDNQYMTARDAARILSAALENEQFQTIFGTVKYTVEATALSEERKLSSNNYLMNNSNNSGITSYYDSRVTGGRTGTTESGDRVVAAVAESGGLEMICVVMGASPNTSEGTQKKNAGYKEISQLLDLGFDGYISTQILYKNQALRQYSVVNGSSDVVVGPAEAVSTVLPQGITQEELTYRYTDISGFSAPIDKGQVVSALEVWYGNVCVAQVDLYAMNSVSVEQVRTTEPAPERGTGMGKILLMIVGVVAAVLVLWAIVKAVIRRAKKAAAKKRSRRYRENRRRSR